jgi:hypothetical protein
MRAMTSPTPAPAAPAATPPVGGLPGGIEIFRAGRHTDDAGVVHEFSEADIAGIAASYQPALREAPLCVGHPAANLPAYGWVASLAANGGHLEMNARDVEPQFAEMVRARRFPKRSASFYSPAHPNNPTPGRWYLRHVGFLGAQPPAVAGLRDIQFSEADSGIVSFSEGAGTPAPQTSSPTQLPQEPQMSDADQAELARLRAEAQANKDALAAAQAEAKTANEAAAAAKAQAASFAERAAADRRAGFASFAEAEVQAGRLLPKDKLTAVAALDALAAAAQPVSFSEGGTTTQVTPQQMCAWLQTQMSSRPTTVQFGEQAGGAVAGSANGQSDEAIDKAARLYQAAHPTVSYAEALAQVTTFTA